MSQLTKQQLEALKPGSTKAVEIPDGMFASTSDLRAIAAGLLHDGMDVERLSPVAKVELRQALETILRLARRP